jgi:hypothetical protein
VLGDFDFFNLLPQRGTVSNQRRHVVSAFLTSADRRCYGNPFKVFKRQFGSYLVPYLPVIPTSIENQISISLVGKTFKRAMDILLVRFVILSQRVVCLRAKKDEVPSCKFDVAW